MHAQAVLERYMHVLDERTNLNRDQLTESCFTQNEIVAFLTVGHGIVISSRQLKRILRRRGLRRRGNCVDLGLVTSTIDQEMEGSGTCIGYRTMRQRLRTEHGFRMS